MPGLVRSQRFVDGPPRWYARRGPVVLSGTTKVEVLSQIWEQDEAALGVFRSRLGEQHGPAARQAFRQALLARG